jgi:hypothetical protein
MKMAGKLLMKDLTKIPDFEAKPDFGERSFKSNYLIFFNKKIKN